MNVSVSEDRIPHSQSGIDPGSPNAHVSKSTVFDISIGNNSSSFEGFPMETTAETDEVIRSPPDQRESSLSQIKNASSNARASASLEEQDHVPKGRSLSISEIFRSESDDEIRERFVIPEYLRVAMFAAVESKQAAYLGGITASERVEAPPFPLIVMINSKSGGRLGPALRSHLEDLITREQVHDLATTPPTDFFRYGLGCLENLAQSRDQCARETRERICVLVAGGDGTVGWVLGTLAELHVKQRVPIPSVGIIPLGTGNDLARSFGWGGSFRYARRSSVKKYLLKAVGSKICRLDSWQVVVKPLPNLTIDFPHSLHPQQHLPMSMQEGSFETPKSDTVASFEGNFYNYFSIGMDAQVAYGFHKLRDKAPYLAQGPVSNKLIYSGYSCTQGWFCTPCSANPRTRGLHYVLQLEIKRKNDSDWETVELPPNVRAVVMLNLQSYASGRNPWGHPSPEYNEKKGFTEPKADDGMLEVFGLFDGWHAALVMLNLRKGKLLAQACSLRLELRGGRRHRVYMQMDGEPWQQPLTKSREPTIIEIAQMPFPSFMLKTS